MASRQSVYTFFRWRHVDRYLMTDDPMKYHSFDLIDGWHVFGKI